MEALDNEEGDPTFSAVTASRKATHSLAHAMGAAAAPGTLIALTGDLGAGKTTFVQGLARGLGVQDPSEVVSPTYTLVNEHAGTRMSLIHIDFYRLEDVGAALDLGLDEALTRSEALVAIEWADKLQELVPPGALWLHIQMLGSRRRKLTLRGLDHPPEGFTSASGRRR